MVSFNLVGSENNTPVHRVITGSEDSALPKVLRDRLASYLDLLHEAPVALQQGVVGSLKEELEDRGRTLEQEAATQVKESRAGLEARVSEFSTLLKTDNYSEFNTRLERLREEGVKAKELNAFLSKLLYEMLPNDLSDVALAGILAEIKDDSGAEAELSFPVKKAHEFFKKVLNADLDKADIDKVLARVGQKGFLYLIHDVYSKKKSGSTDAELKVDAKLVELLMPFIILNQKLERVASGLFVDNSDRNQYLVDPSKSLVEAE